MLQNAEGDREYARHLAIVAGTRGWQGKSRPHAVTPGRLLPSTWHGYRPVAMASFSFSFQCLATLSARGSSGLGADSSAWMLQGGKWQDTKSQRVSWPKGTASWQFPSDREQQTVYCRQGVSIHAHRAL